MARSGGICGWVLAALLLAVVPAQGATAPVRMLIFGAANCPHCAAMEPFIAELQRKYPQVQLERFDVWQDREALQRLVEISRKLGTDSVATPATVLAGRIWFGYDAAIAEQIETALRRCLQTGCPDPLVAAAVPAPEPPPALELPLFGRLDPRSLSLPLLTLLLGLLDSINPCAFFVLLFLLSLMVHARSRGKMLLVGGVFILCSGVVYFLFMAAWLNLFLLIGELPAVTLGAGALAVVVAGFNIKDFFRFHQGASLSIPDAAKPRLFGRMRGLIETSRTPAVLVGTAVLAIVANSYELLCTAGFPMVFTRILTLEKLPAWGYYGYLALYNLIYVLPLLAIVVFFAATLGARKLSEWQGRILKLLSGMLMLTLGLILVVDPGLLQSPASSAGALFAALAATGILAWIWRRFALTRGADRGPP